MEEIILKKLRFDKATTRLIVNAPPAFVTMLGDADFDTSADPTKTGSYDFVLIFATTQSALEQLAKEVETAGAYDCLFWAAYPKMSGSIKSDIKRETTWTAFKSIGLQAVTSVSIDDTWTALRARPAAKVGT